jgi:hypothetical protein
VLGSLAPEAGKTGVIHRLSVAPANAHELSVLPEPVELTSGIVAGDRNYHSPKTKEELASMTVELFWLPTPPRKEIPTPKGALSAEPFSLPDRHRLFAAHRALLRKAGVGRRPLACRLLRKVLSHTAAFLLNHQIGNPPLQLARLLH